MIALPPLTPARSADVAHLLDRVLLPAKATMTFISLFSGIGGFDLGFERAGMQCAAQIEIDAKARAVLNRHFPAVPVMEDVRHAGKHNLPAVDLIAGGFPCQDVSVAGNRKGLAGERSGLWFEFLRIVTELAPKWVVIENVPGLLSSNRGRDFAVILHGLVSVGYRVGWRVLDAQYFGLAQRRKRVFIVASLGDGRCAEVLFERESSAGDIEPRRAEGEGTPTTTEDGVAVGRYVSFGEYRLDSRASTVKARDNKDATDLILASDIQQVTSKTNRSQPSPQSPTLSPQQQVLAFTNRAHTTGDVCEPVRAGSHGALPMVAQALAPTLAKESYSPTKSSSGQMIDFAIPMTNNAVRRLTPTECERLQGFPNGWTDGQPDSARYRQLGNAVAVPVAEWLGRRIREAS